MTDATDTIEITKALCVSTSHVEEGTAQMLDACGLDKTRGVHATGYGWFVYAYHEQEHWIPDDLWACISKAREHGCTYVHFDRDAGVVDGLHVFEW